MTDPDVIDGEEECTCFEIDGDWYVGRFCPVHVEQVDTGELL